MALCLLSAAAIAQNNRLGSWELASVLVNTRSNFSYFAEMQTRSQSVTKDFYYHELKGGVQYTLPNNNNVFIGIGDYRTYDFPGNYKSLSVREFRMWEQFVMKNTLDRIRLEHRYRIEQRWIEGNYRNRFRYRFNPVIPVNKKQLTGNTFYFTAFDEIFFTNEAPYFERNRFFIGAGYQFTKLFALQGGFIRQYDYRKTDDGSGKNFLQFSALFTVDKKPSQKERIPSIMD